jgi:hypothetical protein
MIDWMYDELLIDVGVLFTPQLPEIPVMGVWR